MASNEEQQTQTETETETHTQTTTMKVAEEEDDPPTLSPYALEALQQFLSSQSKREDEQKQQQEENDGAMPLLPEDWRMSQFWYSPETAISVAQEVFSLLSHFPHSDVPPSVACVSCPTLFLYLKKLYPTMSMQLLEYDRRFDQYGSDFTFYDYNVPEDLPEPMKHGYQIVVADPPYLSEECLKKVAQTIKFLAQPGKVFLLLLTGEVQKDRAAKLLGLQPCGFRPEHSSKLGNEFRLYTNYNPGERLGGWELED
ncbi:hypothetical protein BVRB_5g109410 [Beta vulgaris subsp. vulgaris]|uniref:uncharacterized protein LOC104893224 isoform X3 n=1 Tax=Beta vulgaris subsp. vulgaris TaxID=3555 RepID=UPI00053F7A11|nr:uncharacterized protein LOC104893224 isoform X3 [Beta vulgaris subsp. vulgaris]KMT11627.1 hypothetical protein BVRB_5g109410 [Beta vulgaris subsp. vulgaris]